MGNGIGTRRARMSAGLTALALATTAVTACTRPRPPGGGGGTPGPCAPVEILTARGTGESQTGARGLAGLNRGIASQTQAVIYEIVYPAQVANFAAGSAAGSADALARMQARSAACPGMRFFLTGYSQGGMVVTGAFKQLPAALAGKVVGGITYGSPNYYGKSPTAAGPNFAGTGLFGLGTGDHIPESWGGKVREYCNDGDPVCGSGIDLVSHGAYPGSALEREATAWAVSLINGA